MSIPKKTILADFKLYTIMSSQNNISPRINLAKSTKMKLEKKDYIFGVAVILIITVLYIVNSPSEDPNNNTGVLLESPIPSESTIPTQAPETTKKAVENKSELIVTK